MHASGWQKLLNADNNLRSQRIPYDTVCFHCQQAAEKLLKAYLAYMQQLPPITHDLLLLLERVLPLSPEAEALRDGLALLMSYQGRRVHERRSPSRDENVAAISISRTEVGCTHKKVQPTHEGYLRRRRL